MPATRHLLPRPIQNDMIPGPFGQTPGRPEGNPLKVACPSCGTSYTVDSAKIPDKGGRLTCPGCSNQWSVFKPAGAVDATRPAKTFAPKPAPPIAPAPVPLAAPPAPLAAASARVTCPKCSHEFVPGQPPPRAKPASPAAVSTDGRKTILLVEDQDYFSQLARDALGPNYRTLSVASKDEALKLIEADPPQLMILDLSLARGQDGRDLLRALPRKSFPILIFTARDETELYGEPWQELRSLGADGIVLKTMNAGEELKKKVADLLGSE